MYFCCMHMRLYNWLVNGIKILYFAWVYIYIYYMSWMYASCEQKGMQAVVTNVHFKYPAWDAHTRHVICLWSHDYDRLSDLPSSQVEEEAHNRHWSPLWRHQLKWIDASLQGFTLCQQNIQQLIRFPSYSFSFVHSALDYTCPLWPCDLVGGQTHLILTSFCQVPLRITIYDHRSNINWKSVICGNKLLPQPEIINLGGNNYILATTKALVFMLVPFYSNCNHERGGKKSKLCQVKWGIMRLALTLGSVWKSIQSTLLA